MIRYLIVAMIAANLSLPAVLSATEPGSPNDRFALAGLQTGKAIFDVTTKDAGRLLFIVKVIEETWEGMNAQGVQPDFVISFRGGSLPLLREDPLSMDERERTILSEVRERLAGLENKVARQEACNVAGKLFQVTPDQLAPGVTMVGNSLISLIGYQNKGYALVPMN